MTKIVFQYGLLIIASHMVRINKLMLLLLVLILIGCSANKEETVKKSDLDLYNLECLNSEKTLFDYGADDFYILMLITTTSDEEYVTSKNISFFLNNISSLDFLMKMKHSGNTSFYQAINSATNNDQIDDILSLLGYEDFKTSSLYKSMHDKMREDVIDTSNISAKRIHGYQIKLEKNNALIEKVYSTDDFVYNLNDEIYYYEYYRE